MTSPPQTSGHAFLVAANRLPVDRVTAPDGSSTWRPSPGGLVTALVPVMEESGGAWVGWAGAPDEELAPFTAGGVELLPVALSAAEVADYYEGMSNGTIWPLYHDVIVPPDFREEWMDAYAAVNRRFAQKLADEAAPGAVVWVQDYQLQLVPALLRALRPDLVIGYFHHIPFPPYEIFAQLPWRRRLVEGLLGADLLGFQRRQDANNFLRAARRSLGLRTKAPMVEVPEGEGIRTVLARDYPISIDTAGQEQLARDPRTREHLRRFRADLGDRAVVLGVDRLDYTKGIRHRLQAWENLLDDGRVDPAETVLLTVASPSRERVEQYQALRDEIELQVGRINGEHSSLGHSAVHYVHTAFDRYEMSALYQLADVCLVTSLRDGMNLVAKEYVASRTDDSGVLVLSEFTGASDELTDALLVNPHHMSRLEDLVVRALQMKPEEQGRRMRSMRAHLREHTVARWAESFLADLRAQARERR